MSCIFLTTYVTNSDKLSLLYVPCVVVKLVFSGIFFTYVVGQRKEAWTAMVFSTFLAIFFALRSLNWAKCGPPVKRSLYFEWQAIFYFLISVSITLFLLLKANRDALGKIILASLLLNVIIGITRKFYYGFASNDVDAKKKMQETAITNFSAAIAESDSDTNQSEDIVPLHKNDTTV